MWDDILHYQCLNTCLDSCREGTSTGSPKSLAAESPDPRLTWWRGLEARLPGECSPAAALETLIAHSESQPPHLPEPWGQLIEPGTAILRHYAESTAGPPAPYRDPVSVVVAYLELEFAEDGQLTDAEVLEALGAGLSWTGYLLERPWSTLCVRQGQALQVAALAAGEEWGPGWRRPYTGGGGHGHSMPGRGGAP